MGQLLIRQVNDDDIAELKAQARRENISLEQRLRDMVAQTARRDRVDFWEQARISREMTRGANIDLDALLQESRQELIERDPFSGR